MHCQMAIKEGIALLTQQSETDKKASNENSRYNEKLKVSPKSERAF